MNRRHLAFWIWLLALVAILAAGFYLGLVHHEPRPHDDNSPAVTGPQG